MLDNEKATTSGALMDEVSDLFQQGYRFLTATCWNLGASLEILYHIAGRFMVTVNALQMPLLKSVTVTSVAASPNGGAR